MNDADTHLSGPDLEALAAGQTPGTTNAGGHLANCKRCADALAAMRAENELFATELTQEKEMTSVISLRNQQAAQSYKPFVMYLIAASVMLAAAMALIWNGKAARENDESKAVAEQKKDAPPPKDDGKPEEKKDELYDGKTVEQWLAILKKNAQDFPAQTAVTKFDSKALPKIVEFMGQPENRKSNAASVICFVINIDDTGTALLKARLKDEKAGVREAAMELLCSAVRCDPTRLKDVKALLESASKDSDAGVAETAKSCIKYCESDVIASQRGGVTNVPVPIKDGGEAPPAELELPKPVPTGPKEGEAVYEGKTAKQWGEQLRAGAGDTKAAHALSEIGRDALPAVLELLRNPGGSNAIADSKAQNVAVVRQILKSIQLEKGDLAQFVALLRDEQFEVRRGGVELLGALAEQQPGLSDEVTAALNQALKDRDKAVVEAARDQLAKTSAKLKGDELIRKAQAAMEAKDFDTALNLTNEAQKFVDSNRQHELSKMLQDIQIRAMMEKKKAAEIAALRKAEQDRAEADRRAKTTFMRAAIEKANADYNAAQQKGDANAIKNAKAELDRLKAEADAIQPQKKTRGVGEGEIDF